MASSQVVLFYSNHCQHSHSFLKELNQNNITITTVCVDTTSRQRIPDVVKSVPTLIVAGESEPRVGERAFQWLSQQSRNRNQHTPPNHPQYKQNPNNQEQSADGPIAWQLEEMGSSFSDGYSFIDEHTSNSIPKNFQFLNEETNTSGQQQQQQQPPPPGNRSIAPNPHAPPVVQQRSDDLTDQMENLQQRRESDFSQHNRMGGGNMRFEDLQQQ